MSTFITIRIVITVDTEPFHGYICVALTIAFLMVNVLYDNDEQRLSLSRYGVHEAIQVPQDMSPVYNESCVVSAAGCRWCLGRVPLLNGERLHCSHPYLDVAIARRIARSYQRSTCLTSATSCSVDALSCLCILRFCPERDYADGACSRAIQLFKSEEDLRRNAS